MIKTLLPFDKVSQLSKTDVAYAKDDAALAPFYKYPHARISFQKIIQDKSAIDAPRQDLVAVLRDQYANLPKNEAVDKNIESLLSEKAFTVTTAHQPCLFLGPLYTLYKSFTTINLAEAVSGLVNPEHNIVPVFVIGGEDHDLEEMNHISLFGKEIVWETEQRGSVGMMSTADMGDVLAQLNEILGDGDYSRTMYEHVHKAYTEQATVAEATRALLHDIFGRYGLVVLDMNDARLKRHFAPIIKEELTERTSFRLVSQTLEAIEAAGFKAQAAPREINLFYLKKGFRERIVEENGKFKVLNSDMEFTKAEILRLADEQPECFSPNVILRPLYQEVILPNLAYVGGGGELAYWLERKSLFEHFQLNFPLLVRRASVVWYDKDVVKKLAKLDISHTQFFENTDALVRQFVENQTQIETNLSREKGVLSKLFKEIAQKAGKIDPTLKKAVLAEETKQLSTLDQIESRIHRAEKQKHEVAIRQIETIKEKVFPNNGLQERTENFMAFYIRYGRYYFHTLKEHLKPMEKGMVVLVDDRN